jgi:hypothetical protein
MEGHEQGMKVCLMDIGEIVYEVEEMMKSWKVQGKKWKDWECALVIPGVCTRPG